MIKLNGTPASIGIAIGTAYVVSEDIEPVVECYEVPPGEIRQEVARFCDAVEVSKRQLEQIFKDLSEVVDKEHARIIEAQAMFLDDASLVDFTIEEIQRTGLCASFIFNKVIHGFVDQFKMIDDPIIQSRDRDLLDLNSRVLSNLGCMTEYSLENAPSDAIIIAHDIAPSETPFLFSRSIKAFVLDKGGPTSHTAIIAKAMEIPAVVALSNASVDIKTGDNVIVDGSTGHVYVSPTEQTIKHYEGLMRSYSAWLKEAEQIRTLDAETRDGYCVTLRANVELPEEVLHVSRHGCRGIGLFRTEFLYMNRLDLPQEEEQFEIYKTALQQLHPDSIVFRTLDIGGDKFFSHVVLSQELNPNLGQRAVRLCLKQPELLRAQFRAILRASAYGNAKIMIPMISGLDEFLSVKEHYYAVREELSAKGIAYDKSIPFGTMIEVPGAAMIADDLARECDFFSIGTNDLIQYTLAVDRSNEAVAYLYEPANPAILKLLQRIIEAAHLAGIPVGVCGEAASDPIMALILLGMGVNELSMSAISAPPVKKFIRSLSLLEAKNLVFQIMQKRTIVEVKQAIRSVLRPHLVRIDELQRDAPNPWFKSAML